MAIHQLDSNSVFVKYAGTIQKIADQIYYALNYETSFKQDDLTSDIDINWQNYGINLPWGGIGFFIKVSLQYLNNEFKVYFGDAPTDGKVVSSKYGSQWSDCDQRARKDTSKDEAFQVAVYLFNLFDRA